MQFLALKRASLCVAILRAFTRRKHNFQCGMFLETFAQNVLNLYIRIKQFNIINNINFLLVFFIYVYNL